MSAPRRLVRVGGRWRPAAGRRGGRRGRAPARGRVAGPARGSVRAPAGRAGTGRAAASGSGPGVTLPEALPALGSSVEALLGGLGVAALLLDQPVGEILVAGHVLAEPVVHGAVVGFLDLLVGHGWVATRDRRGQAPVRGGRRGSPCRAMGSDAGSD